MVATIRWWAHIGHPAQVIAAALMVPTREVEHVLCVLRSQQGRPPPPQPRGSKRKPAAGRRGLSLEEQAAVTDAIGQGRLTRLERGTWPSTVRHELYSQQHLSYRACGARGQWRCARCQKGS